MKVLVTGSRDWTDYAVIRDYIKASGATVVVHGDHWEGADRLAKRAARELGIEHKPYPAEWKMFGRGAGPRRNQQMIDSEPDIALCLGFPLPGSQGTIDCMKRAAKAGIRVIKWPEPITSDQHAAACG